MNALNIVAQAQKRVASRDSIARARIDAEWQDVRKQVLTLVPDELRPFVSQVSPADQKPEGMAIFELKLMEDGKPVFPNTEIHMSYARQSYVSKDQVLSNWVSASPSNIYVRQKHGPVKSCTFSNFDDAIVYAFGAETENA